MNFEAILGVMLPVFAMVLGIGLVMFAIYLDFSRKRTMLQLHHAERMAAIEKGIELPPLPEELFRGRGSPASSRRVGLILLFIGVATTLALWASAGDIFWWGLVPTGLGIAFLLTAFFDARELRQQHRGSGQRERAIGDDQRLD